MRIVVTDAAGRPLRDAAVAVDGGAPAAVDANGVLSLPDPTAATTYHAGRARLHPVSVQVQPGAEWTWDDPGSTLSPGPPATLTIPLPAVAAAPTERRDDAELMYDPKLPHPSRPTRPHGILLDAGGRPYGLEDGPLSFHVAGPDLLGDPAGDGWGKLDDVAAGQVDPAARGQFAFLEWGGMEGTARLLVAVWAPWPRGPAEPRPWSDAAVYFSPTTTRERGYPEDAPPYRGEYPYGLVPEAGHWMQNYAGLPIRHMFRERFMAYQLIAARRRAPLIFPVQPAAHWQAFATPAGVGRMVAEVLLWLHRLQAPLLSYPPRSMPPDPPQRRLGAWRPPPKLRRLACSGFSAGVGALARLIEKARLPEGFDDDVFGAEGEAMQDAWKELWDFDGPRHVTGATAQWEKKLGAWCGQYGSNRAVALYHTEQTSWSTADIASLNSLFPKTKGVPKHSGERLAVYRTHITRGSAAFFSTRYLFNGPPGPGWQRGSTPGRAKDAPEFWEQRHKTEPEAVHLMIPMFAFGHAAGMSTLQNLS